MCDFFINSLSIKQSLQIAKFVSPLKSSQGLSVVAESPFTFQLGLHSCYYATI
jgi:hypothetical protein